MKTNMPMATSQRVVQVCLFLVAAIALLGGALQMYLGEPDVSPRLDNVHRFMAGVYFSTGLINLWAALTIRQQGTLVFLPELLLPVVICLAQLATNRQSAKASQRGPEIVWHIALILIAPDPAIDHA